MSLWDSSVKIREICSEEDENAEQDVHSSDWMSKVGVWISEGFFVLIGGGEPELSLSSSVMGFFEEPGWLSFSSIISMYNLLP